MKHRGASKLMLSGMAVVVLTAGGCGSMKGFHSGSDATSASERGRSAGQGDSDKPGQSGSGYAAEEDISDGQYPSIGRQDKVAEAEGGALRGFAPLVNGQIVEEERLSRSSMGALSLPVDRDEKWFAELRREEEAAAEAGLKDVFYGYNQYSISDAGGTLLTANAGWLKDNPKASLKISGHCDERGTHDYNLVLGEKRAKAARSFLVDLGVSPKQVSIVSYGKDRPFCADHDEACHQQNRRGHMLLRK
jgi:peptidoglycan-associated lipoprotein